MCSWQRKKYFNSVFRYLEIFTVDTTLKTQVVASFLKIKSSMESEITSLLMVIWNLNFSYSAALKSMIHLALRINLSPMHDFVTSCICHLENLGSLSYIYPLDICIYKCYICIYKCWHISLHSSKTTFINNTTSLIT